MLVYLLIYLLASERSERDRLGVDNAKSGICYWRASVASVTVLGVDNAKSGICYNWRASAASETLTGVKMKKSGMFVCMDVRMSFCTLTLAFLCQLCDRPRPKLH